jgi:hypothetical protein
MATVDEFLKTGRIGPISCEMSTDEIQQVLGKPEHFGNSKHSSIWKYGSLQLFFSRPAKEDPVLLGTIGLYFHGPDEQLPSVLALTGWVPTGSTTYDEFLKHVADEGIAVSEESASGPSQYLLLESSVRVTFDEGLLYCIHYTAAATHDVQPKQVTIAIARQDLEAIRRQARSLGVSVSRLCSRWIEERIADLQPTLTGAQKSHDR